VVARIVPKHQKRFYPGDAQVKEREGYYMAQTTTSPATPPHVSAFNQKVADLVKATSPHELADVLQHPASLLRAASDNVNQNQGGRHQLA
jgi:hypothetical protein